MMCCSSLLNLIHLDHVPGSNCENVLIHGHGKIAGGGHTLAWRIIKDERLRLKDYIASLGIHMICCDSITTDHCIFRSQGAWSGDGRDPDSSDNCTISACRFYMGDDAVSIKFVKNPESNLIARPSRHIRVFDCFSAYGHGAVMGREMSGGIEDLRIWDCDLRASMLGIEIKATKRRGGMRSPASPSGIFFCPRGAWGILLRRVKDIHMDNASAAPMA